MKQRYVKPKEGDKSWIYFSLIGLSIVLAVVVCFVASYLEAGQ